MLLHVIHFTEQCKGPFDIPESSCESGISFKNRGFRIFPFGEGPLCRCKLFHSNLVNSPIYLTFGFSLMSLVACILCLMKSTWSLPIFLCGMLLSRRLFSHSTGLESKNSSRTPRPSASSAAPASGIESNTTSWIWRTILRSYTADVLWSSSPHHWCQQYTQSIT